MAGRFEEAEAAARVAVDSARASGSGGLASVSASDVLVEAMIANGRATLDETLALALDNLRRRESHLGLEHADLVPTLLNLGDVLTALARFDEAIAATTRAVRLCERASGPDGVDVATALDHQGAALAGAGRYQDALKSLERSLGVKEKALPATDVAIARTLEDIGNVLQHLGHYTRASEPVRRAAAIQDASNPDHPANAKILSLVADQLWFEGNLLESKEASERALAIAEATLRADHPAVASSLATLAGTLADLGDLERSLALKERALAIAQRTFGPNHHVTAEYLHGLGLAELRYGDYPAARRHVQQALGIFEERYGAWHEYVATSLYVLALADARLGDYVSARRDQARVVAIHSRVGGPNHPFVAIALTELARVFNEQGDPGEALPLLERALAIRQERLGLQHRDVALTLADLASTLVAIGRPTRAQELANRALRIWERLDAPDAPEYATVLALYARLQGDRGDIPGAREYYERALAIRARVFGTSNPVYAEAQSALATTQARLGDHAAALSTAASAESTGREHLRLMLRSLPERQALNYAAARPRGLNLMLSLATSMRDAVPAALEGLIRGRALVLDEMAARHGGEQGARGAVDSTVGELSSAQQRLANLMVRGPGPMSPTQYATVLEDARRRSELAEQALADRNARFRAERTRARIGLKDVLASLPSGSALVSFVLFDRTHFQRSRQGPTSTPSSGAQAQSSASYLAFVLRAGRKPEAVQLGGAQSIDGLVSKWRGDIAAEALGARTASGEPRVSSRGSGAALRAKVWDPLAPHLDGARQLFIVPDGTLGLVPFAALPVARDSFVLEQAPAIHYLSAERDVVSMTGDRTPTSGMLAIGGPAFDDVPTAVTPSKARSTATGNAAETAALRTGSGACGSLQTLRFEPLAGTLQEAQEVSRLWPAPLGIARALVGREASERAFKQDASGYRVLHLATHGFFLDGSCLPESAGANTRGVGGLSTKTVENPLRLSGLALAGANRRQLAQPDEDDGILTAEEVASLDLQGVEWAVLSACDTGVGEIKAGEGVFGLRRAFQVAGARTVVMSLWSVDDQATRAWMRALYEGRFQKRLSTADAVHQASLGVLRDRRARGQSTHPFYWAAFVAAGDWR
jgi:CHAT domain-containing protein/tetratricopeptide (TPR) repeat protein